MFLMLLLLLLLLPLMSRMSGRAEPSETNKFQFVPSCPLNEFYLLSLRPVVVVEGPEDDDDDETLRLDLTSCLLSASSTLFPLKDSLF